MQMSPPPFSSSASPAAPATPAPGLMASMVALRNEIVTLAFAYVELAGLQMRQWIRQIAFLLLMGLALLMLTFSAWLGLSFMLVLWLMRLGIDTGAALLVGVVLQAAAAWSILALLRNKWRGLWPRLRVPHTL